MPTVLIADDNAQNLYFLEALLRGNGFAVRSAADGAAALAAALREPPDLIVTDILMPVMDGYAFCRECKNDERLRGIPFIFYTATFIEAKDEALALGLGADRFVIKPQEPEALMAIIHEVLAKAGSAEAAAASDRDDRELYKEHNQALFRKLEKKMADLEEANRALAGTLADRQRLEDQLRHSQKMEAVGQLASGVAHDFNNILSVIMGFASMLKMDRKLDGQQAERLDQILAAAERGAYMTRSLLSFSRKQVMKLESADLSDIVGNVQKFLARIIGEDIQLKVLPGQATLPVRVDSCQIEQVLMNLATNARDAMPKGGVLTIATGLQEVDADFVQAHGYGEPGSYACLTVSDTGVGMDETTRNKIFEPFFTTKDSGKGTGLGMSMVYGIVKQHNGFINVYSEPGKGTTLKIYLPISSAAAAGTPPLAAFTPPRGGNETILVAEDNEAVRDLVSQILEEFGYRVILAVDGQEVVDRFRERPQEVDLIVLDVIMPKRDGRAAAEELRQLRPGVTILFSSGYPADFIEGRDILAAGEAFIVKPVRPLDLLRKVREMLDRT